jgi:2-oxo-3-hexenedioate decarboxylase
MAPLAAGEVVTTGTLTDAQPMAPGQRWRTAIDGAPLPGLALEVLP